MYLDSFRKYRSEALKQIVNNKKIKELLLNKQDVTDDDSSLIGKYVFPYQFLPGTTEEAKSCITMLLSAPDVDSRSILCMKMIFYVFSHESLIWTVDDNGLQCLRYDLISEELDKMFNGSDAFGLKLHLVSRHDGYMPMDNFHGCQLIYETSDFNYKV